MQEAGIDRGGQQVGRRGNGVDIAGQVEVKILHRHDLAVAAAGCAALDAECGTLRWLADAGDDAFAQLRAKGLAHADRGGRLAFAQRGRSYGGDVDVLALGAILQTLEDIEVDLGLVLAVQVEVVLGQPKLGRHLSNRFQGSRLGDVDITGNRFFVFELGHFRDSFFAVHYAGGRTCQQRRS